MEVVDEFMTIGVFAERTGLSISAIRFYADQNLLVPAEVDGESGYRRYAEAQVSDGVLIRDLRRLDMSLKDIALALEQTELERKALVERHVRRLEAVVVRAHDLARAMGVPDRREETTMSTTVQAIDFAAALDQVLPAAGTDTGLPHLMGVLIEAKAGSVRMVATDRFRLAVRDLVPMQFGDDFAVVVPAAALQRWRAALTRSAELALRAGSRNLEARSSDLDLAAAIMPVAFPAYEKYLAPADDVTVAQVDRVQLLAALGGVGDGAIVTMSTSDRSVSITNDQRTVDIDAACTGPVRQVGVNAGFVVDATQDAVGAEVVIEIQDALNPVVFRSADDGTFTTRVMPYKTD